MIEVYFTDIGFYVKSPSGENRYLFDIPSEVCIDAFHLYTFRWLVFNEAMSSIKELIASDSELLLSSDSRLIEELQGSIQPDHYYAKSSLQYFMLYDALKFKRIEYRKCSKNFIYSMLHNNGELSAT